MSSPLVTVSLPIYNAERFLAESIASIQAQTFADFEVIAVLDGCTDRSEEMLMDLKDERFVVIMNENNQGVVAATNAGLSRARGMYFGRSDADDVAHPEKLQRQVDFLNHQPEVDILGTWFDSMDERGHQIRKAFPFPADHDEIVRDFRVRNSIGGPTALSRAERLRAVGGYTSQAPYAEDLTLWLKCLANGFRLANIPEVLYHYRVLSTQLSQRRSAETNRMANLAYQTYGPLIWGKDAPDIEFGAPLHRRVVRKLKRMFR